MKEKVSVDLFISRDDEAGSQQIPEAVLECSGLMKAKKLLVHADSNYILITETCMPAKELLELISSLRESVEALLFELVHASQHIHLKCDWGEDPLEMIDEDVVHELIGCGASMEGLRLLLMKEAIETDEE